MKRQLIVVVLLAAAALAGCTMHADEGLHAAAERGDAAAVRKYLAEGADANKRDSNGVTALMWASRGGHTEVVKALLDAKADPNLRDCAANGWTALIHAIHKNQNDAARTLVERGADVNASGGDCRDQKVESGMTPIMFAAMYDNAEMVKLLVARGATPYGSHAEDNVLSYAIGGAAFGKLSDIDRASDNPCPTETVKVLLEKFPDLEMRGGAYDRTALYLAKQRGCEEIIRLLENKKSVLASDEGGSRLGSHFVKVSPSCWTDKSSASEGGKHSFRCGANVVEINDEELIVNGKSYGTLKEGDAVEVNHGKVLINSKEVAAGNTVASN